jgi:cyanophycin synthetase
VPGEPLLLLYERLQPVADLLQTLGAAPMRPPAG